MRTDDARSVPVASTQKLIERGAITTSSTDAFVFGRTAEKAPALKNDTPIKRETRTIKARPIRFVVLVVSLDRSFPGRLVSGSASLIDHSRRS